MPPAEPAPDQPTAAQSEPPQQQPDVPAEKVLCPHCKRTASNGLKCLGICVADSDY